MRRHPGEREGPPKPSEETPVKIVSIETLRTAEFANVIWVRVHTDAGVIGLGETFYGAGAVEAHSTIL